MLCTCTTSTTEIIHSIYSTHSSYILCVVCYICVAVLGAGPGTLGLNIYYVPDKIDGMGINGMVLVLVPVVKFSE